MHTFPFDDVKEHNGNRPQEPSPPCRNCEQDIRTQLSQNMYPLSNQARKQKSNPQSTHHTTITAIRTSGRRATRERLRTELHADSTRSRHQLRPSESHDAKTHNHATIISCRQGRHTGHRATTSEDSSPPPFASASLPCPCSRSRAHAHPRS